MGTAQELDDMKKRLKEMEDEAAALREMQSKVEHEMGAVQGYSQFLDAPVFTHAQISCSYMSFLN